jgi:hypothetical protein
MILHYKIALSSFFILLIVAGCYTTRQHPIVMYEDEHEMQTRLIVDFKDRCRDCHTDADTLNLVAASIPDLIQIHNYSSEYYADAEEVNRFYNERPWWIDYDWSHAIAG